MADNKPILIALGIALIALVGASVYYFSSPRVEPVVEATQISIPEPESVAVLPEPEPEAEPEPAPLLVDQTDPLPEAPLAVMEEPEPAEPDFVLPLLNGSDALIRDGLISLSRHEGINRWVSVSQLIRKFVGFTNAVANGEVVKEPLQVLGPIGSFKALKLNNDRYLMDRESFERYSMFVEIFVSLDSQRVAELYVLILPLLEQAYTELGNDDGSFNAVLFKAVGRLLETPVVEGDIGLVRPVVMYHYTDPTLEALSPAQKQLVRMGPANTRRLQSKMSDIAGQLRKILD
ncbi:MAG: DUF3014 domain-containing protein [Pseudomonadota bacterium]|nr:DUF3014 domain-containing protein [Pseudomonadota bacterium]